MDERFERSTGNGKGCSAMRRIWASRLVDGLIWLALIGGAGFGAFIALTGAPDL